MEDTQEIWKIYHKQLLGFISSKISNKETAQDVLHEVFIKIHSKMHTLNDITKMRAWIYQITRNTIIDYYRKHKSKEEIPLWVDEEFQNSDEVLKEELSFCLGYLIGKLPQKYKTAIQISEIEGKTQQELADYENITLAGAKSRVQRGRDILKHMIFDCCELEINKVTKNMELNVKDEENCILVQEKKISNS